MSAGLLRARLTDKARGLFEMLADGRGNWRRTAEVIACDETWAEAQTFDDLCELTAQWVRGEIPSQPGYTGSTDLDEASGLVDAVVALNRAGWMTTSSQEGHDGPGFDGAHWVQFASVTGYVPGDRVADLWDAIQEAGFELFIAERRDRWGIDVTFRGGRPYTNFGGHMSRSYFNFYYGGLSDQAYDELAAAESFCIYDPTPGRDTLWPALLKILEDREMAYPRAASRDVRYPDPPPKPRAGDWRVEASDPTLGHLTFVVPACSAEHAEQEARRRFATKSGVDPESVLVHEVTRLGD